MFLLICCEIISLMSLLSINADLGNWEMSGKLKLKLLCGKSLLQKIPVCCFCN